MSEPGMLHLPPLDRRKGYPAVDEPILHWYRGIFDVAYVALHPFVHVPGKDRPVVDHGPVFIKRWELPADADIKGVLAAASAQSKATAEERQQLLSDLKARGIAVPWRAVAERAGLAGLGALNRALLTITAALRPELEDADGAARLEAFCQGAGLLLPTAGEFQAVLERPLGIMFQRAGIAEIVLGDEFSAEAQPAAASRLLEAEPLAWTADINFTIRNIYAADLSVLATIDWDSFFMLICGTRERLAAVGLDALFDGFWCDATTRHDWWK
jgi:hypothetical protein